MTEPTAYDFIQDTRLDALEGVLADVTVPGTGEVSFPVAQQGMDTTMWQQLFRDLSGVIDTGGDPYRLTSSDSPGSGTVTIHPDVREPAQARLAGYAHRLPAAKTFTVPAVTSATPFTIALQYDPTKHKRPGGPIILGLFQGALDRTQDKEYLVLHTSTRQPSTVVSQMTWRKVRQTLRPSILVGTKDDLPDYRDGMLWGYEARTLDTGEIFQFRGNVDGGSWRNLSNPDWTPITLASSYTVQGSVAPAYRVIGNRIHFRGLFRRTSGSIPTTTEVFGWITGLNLGFKYVAGVGSNAGSVRIETANGTTATDNLRVQAAATGMSWASLDGISFELP